ncbi:hypothetical protein ACET3Z_010647 [Daucus carota]
MAKKRSSRIVKSNEQVEINKMPEDMMVEILSRLPVKTLVTLRSVCELWKSYISHPHFANLQIARNMTNPEFYDFFIAHCYDEGRRWPYKPSQHKLYVINKKNIHKPMALDLPLPSCSEPNRFSVVGSCNGLLCLAYFGSRKKKRQHRIYLWNPVTRQHKDVCMRKQNLQHRVSLGFGFDDASRDYKIVSVLTDRFDFVSRVSVYSLGQDCWNRIDHAEMKARVLQQCAVIVKGLFYWLMEEKSDPRRFGFVWFNVQTEELGTTSLPDGISCPSVFELKGSVAISTGYIINHEIGIWKQDDRGWIKIHAIKNSGITGFYGCLNTGEFVGGTYYGIALCDPANKVIKYSNNLPRGILRAYNYSASLVKLN